MKKIIKETARFMRKKSTKGELIFWEAVRNRKHKGLKFLRQHPIQFEMDGRKRFFVADFFCFEQKLIVEIDGKIHEEQKEYDTLRTHIIKNSGFQVIRIKNEDIENSIENVLKRI